MTKRERVADKFLGHCAYCGDPLSSGWCMDHVLPVHRDGKTMNHPDRDIEDNLVPSCRVCNYAKSDGDVETLRTRIAAQVDRARQESWSFRMAEKYGLVQEVKRPVVFLFEIFKTPTLSQGQGEKE